MIYKFINKGYLKILKKVAGQIWLPGCYLLTIAL